MSKRWIIVLKAVVHILCLLPFLLLVRRFRADDLGGDPVNTITHFSGDWAIYLLLISLAVTPIRRLTQRLGWLVRFRRLLGLWAFFYATLHLATYVFLFSGYDMGAAIAGVQAGHVAVLWQQFVLIWPAIVDDVLKRRFIQVGFLAWLILLALALTSPAFIMRKMGGKNWQRLHRLVYAAAIAAVIHYWWLVKKGVTTPWKVTAVLALLLLARVVWTTLKRRPRSVASSGVPAIAIAPR